MLLSSRMRRLILGALAAVLVAPAPARAADPIMALGDVRAGARCSGLTVVRGTAISSFQVEVLEVIDRGRPDVATILVRVSGPLVDATGIGPGFSGSPILCPDAAGVQRNIGAISAGIGEYGGAVGLATPIERILSDPVLPPSSAGRSAVAGARSLEGPLTLSGVRPSVAAMFARAARKTGHPLVASPASPRSVAHPPQPLVPGAAASVGMTSGDVGVGSIGTVAYADAGNVWLFGHPLDGAGRRSLFLQDATIHTVVNNPVGAPDLSTYKLGSPGNDLGTVTSDTINAVAGRLGGLPRSYPLRVTARDLDTGRVVSRNSRIADEGDVGSPAGPSILGLAGASSVAEAAARALGGAPARQTAEMCVAIALRELKRPARFCQHYAVAGGGANALSGALAVDVAKGAEVIDEYRFGVLHPTSVEVGVRVRRGLRQAVLVGASGPRRARPGQRIALRLRLRRTLTGVRFTRTIRVRVPGGIVPGRRTIRLQGTDADEGVTPEDDSELTFLFEEENSSEPPPESVAEVHARIEALERFDGVTARIGPAELKRYRDPKLRISGDASVAVQIRRARRR